MMVKGGVFSFKSEAESQFASRVYEIFSALTRYDETTVTLVYKDQVYPDEGFSYKVPTLIFGPSNSVENPFFSIGHGVNLLMEGTEIAASFLQYSTWALRYRIGGGTPKIIMSGRPRREIEYADKSVLNLAPKDLKSDEPDDPLNRVKVTATGKTVIVLEKVSGVDGTVMVKKDGTDD